MAILFVASESAELKPFANLLTNLRKLNWPLDYAFEGILGSRRILLAANGAGPKLAAHAVEVAIRAGMSAELSSSALEAVVSTGYCGAINPTLSQSQIVVATAVLSPPAAVTFECAPVLAETPYVSGIVLSENRISHDTASKRLLQASGAIAVDMESAGVASRTKRAGLPFYCIKVVTDRADESFGFDLNEMRTTEGRISRGKIVLHALAHPGQLSGLLHWRRRAGDASKVLGDFLVSCRIVREADKYNAELAQT